MTKALEFPFSNLLASPWLVPKPIPQNSYFKTPSLPQAPESPPLSVPIGSTDGLSHTEDIQVVK